METLGFRANCKTSCAKQKQKKNLHQRSLIFFTTCVICKQNKERQRVEEQLPKFSPTFVFYDLCGEIANVG
jgi:hypothetical protein